LSSTATSCRCPRRAASGSSDRRNSCCRARAGRDAHLAQPATMAFTAVERAAEIGGNTLLLVSCTRVGDEVRFLKILDLELAPRSARARPAWPATRGPLSRRRQRAARASGQRRSEGKGKRISWWKAVRVFRRSHSNGAGSTGRRSCDLVFFCTSIWSTSTPGAVAETGTEPDSAPQ